MGYQRVLGLVASIGIRRYARQAARLCAMNRAELSFKKFSLADCLGQDESRSDEEAPSGRYAQDVDGAK
jgi:hypothetical protein